MATTLSWGRRRLRVLAHLLLAVAALTLPVPPITLGQPLGDLTASPSAAQSSPPAAPEPAAPRAAGTPDPRFGVAVTSSTTTSNAATLSAALGTLNAGSWYSYFGGPAGLTAGRVELLRPGESQSDLAQRAQANPGGTWLLGNEPNTSGQDGVSPKQYSDFLNTTAKAIRALDPAAKIAGPNVLNWDKTCVGCGGYTSGHAWSDEFLADYTARYGPLPFSVWAIHSYSLDWDHLPLADSASDQAQVVAARSWLDSKGLNLPIWLTEFGVIWGYEGLQFVPVTAKAAAQSGPHASVMPRPPASTARAGANYVAQPVGRYRDDLVSTYVDEMLGWLTTTGAALKVERWFLYTVNAPIEVEYQASTALSLLKEGTLTLTPAGERYQAWAKTEGVRRYYFPWYDSVVSNGSDWILIGNPNPTPAQATVTIAGVLRGTYTIPANGRVTPSYPRVTGGPVVVESQTELPLVVSQRSLFGASFNELPAATSNDFGTEQVFAWYDSRVTNGSDWILVGNPNVTETLQVRISIAGREVGNYNVPPGGSVTPSFPDTVGGPVRVYSTNQRLFYASQRVVYGESFTEHWGTSANRSASGPSNQLAMEWWGTWYDAASFTGDWLIIANPNLNAIQAEVWIGGTKRETVTVPPSGTATPSYGGLVGGPVRVISLTSDSPILVGQRTVYKGNFNEVTLTPANQLGGANAAGSRFFSWYDSMWSGDHTWVLVGNPGTSQITARISIGGTDRGSFTVKPGGSVFPIFSGVADGPVVITADGPFLASQRTLQRDNFEETVATPLR